MVTCQVEGLLRRQPGVGRKLEATVASQPADVLRRVEPPQPVVLLFHPVALRAQVAALQPAATSRREVEMRQAGRLRRQATLATVVQAQEAARQLAEASQRVGELQPAEHLRPAARDKLVALELEALALAASRQPVARPQPAALQLAAARDISHVRPVPARSCRSAIRLPTV